MQPFTGPPPAPKPRQCDICGKPLPSDRLRCELCVQATWRAIRRAEGRTVRPSDVEKERFGE